MRNSIIRAIAVAAVLSCTAVRPAASCAPDDGASHTVVRVVDGETIRLDDGSDVRLVGALAPRPARLDQDPEAWPPAREAKHALESLVSGRTVDLRFDGRRRDRYGRLLAQVYVRDGDGTRWVQEELVRSGQARAYALPGLSGCLPQLAAAEAAARDQRLGLWAQPIYEVMQAEGTSRLLGRIGQFAVVEGKVHAVAHRARVTFINFGADWRTDFTASVDSRIVKAKADAVTWLDALAGRRVRVRGWIERRNGPVFSLGSLDEIELLDPPGISAGSSAPPPEPTP